MTPVDEAVERVRAYVEAMGAFGDAQQIDLACARGTAYYAELRLGDLRALLSALELGRHLAKDALPGARHPVEQASGCPVIAAIYMPDTRSTNSRFTLHRWRMDGSVVAEVIDVESFPATEYRSIGGEFLPVPPAAMLAAVEAARERGEQINAPLYWRVVTELAPETQTGASRAEGEQASKTPRERKADGPRTS